MKSFPGTNSVVRKYAKRCTIRKANSLSQAKRELKALRIQGIRAGIMWNTTTMDYEVVEEEYWGDYMMGVHHGEFEIEENIK